LNRGPPRFDGERRFGGDRDGYRGGPRGPGGDFGDKGGAPADYRPSFGVTYCNILIIIVFLFVYLLPIFMTLYCIFLIYFTGVPESILDLYISHINIIITVFQN